MSIVTSKRLLMQTANELVKTNNITDAHFENLLLAIAKVYEHHTGDGCECLIRIPKKKVAA